MLHRIEMTEIDTVIGHNMCNSRFFPWWLLLVWGIFTLLIGLMLLFAPGMTTALVITFMGTFWLVSGLFSIGSIAMDRSNAVLKIFLSVINIMAGVLILLYPVYSSIVVLSFFVIFMGFWALFVGASHLYHAYTDYDAGNIVIGVISLIFGLLLLFNPFLAARLFPFIAGGFAIVFGLAAIGIAFGAKKCQVPEAA